MRGAPRTPKCRALDSQSPIWQRPAKRITASSFKFRANAPERRKAISYQITVPSLKLVLVRTAQDEIIDIGLFDGALKILGNAIKAP